jgi:hypothetical protein
MASQSPSSSPVSPTQSPITATPIIVTTSTTPPDTSSSPSFSPSEALVVDSSSFSSIVSSTASGTYYMSFPQCCKNLTNYNPAAPTAECEKYNGCANAGLFAGIGVRNLSFVQS